MSKKDIQKASENLKKAVPLMIKNQVPTTPTNYALWYTYVDNSLPELNKELDQVVSDCGLCPPATGEALYRNYVASKQETDVQQLRTSLEKLITEVSHSMNDTLANTSTFQKQMDRSFDNLSRVEDEGLSFEEVMGLVRNLITESKDIRSTTQFLNSQLNVASKEIGELKSQLAEFQQDALYDGLTNLLNRRAFDKDLSTFCRNNSAFSLIILDIDHFKSFNDQYGHVFGDAVIRSIAKRLRGSCREGIAAYRYGGEEFAFIVPDKKLRLAIRFAESVRSSFEKISVKDKRSGQQVDSITSSFGVAEFQEGESPDCLIERADTQLYEAKRLGRNRVMPIPK
ncbi:GGDEF domain-containing protein [Vibrio penaeicida]|uniref:diguanylate cyclase n=1 Tax=Vibrio penaeicida TaxID=104609 RepID=A0AAV5P0G1_9VIBR|nr:GGDEF domain-containing protein [Vibrio penaeicida]RTZ21810.1 GGDEF domain-containing protein [Vibrio penaeicida]GLQ76300.1 GGDEF domain-containing protein [Vibrio penaeicida]